jgi:hypothetical protein
MEQEIHVEVCESVVVAESPLLRVERSSRYGSVPGLPDEELIDPAEVERLFFKQEFAPILALPVKTKKGFIMSNVDEDGTIDWGAFATVDFDRNRPAFDKRMYKADKLKEEFANQCLMIETISARIKTKAKYEIIEHVSKGTLDIGDIADCDMYFLVERYLWAKKLQREIAELEKKSREKRKEASEKFWESVG